MPRIEAVTDLAAAMDAASGYDGVVVITANLSAPLHTTLDAAIKDAAALDDQLGRPPSMIPNPTVPGGRILVAATGPVERDWDDVRRFRDAAHRALIRARDAGMRQPLVVLSGAPETSGFEQVEFVSLSAALGALWRPLEAREAHSEAAMEPIERIGFSLARASSDVVTTAEALEAGRRMARDLGGTEPERMAPPRFAQAVKMAFEDTDVEVSVVRERERLDREYPLLMAVARASLSVEAHHPRVVRLEYSGPGPVERTLLLAGKGVTYDTGGADLKTGGSMAGMSRDKLGAAAAAGFVETARRLAVPGLRIIAELGLVRNSAGAAAFVADEIVTGHSGCRVRVGNTDAEGRLVLADLLSHLREAARETAAPQIFSIATLTGHAFRAVGPYTLALDNGPARAARVADYLGEVGDSVGEPVEVSRLRPEDYDMVAPRTPADDVLSSNNLPSSGTARGHQFPMAFLAVASGLVSHGLRAPHPLPFTHLDIGGSGVLGGDWQHGAPTGAPITVLTAAFLR